MLGLELAEMGAILFGKSCCRDYISRHLFRALNSEVEKHRKCRDEEIWRSPQGSSADAETWEIDAGF